MRSLLKPWPLLLCILLSGGVLATAARDEKSKTSSKKEESGKKKKQDKEKGKPEDDAQAAGGDKGKLSIPLIPGHDSKGLKIPYYDTAGKLQMVFNIGVASRLDNERVQMSEMQVETYDAQGAPEMTIDFPTSVLNMTTRVITSQTKTSIYRSDFEITGDAVEFNTATKEGRLVGNVRMIIYDLQTDVDEKPEGTTPTEQKPNE